MLFFSYSRGNLIVVRSVAAELRRLGYRTWLDLESLRPGERWREAIERALAASDAMVYCISRLSVDSAWTSVELRAALERGLPVIPLMIDTVPLEALPPALRGLHFVSTTEYAAHEAPRKAAQVIARSVGRPAPAEAWSALEEAAALQVLLRADQEGATSIGWRSDLWQSPEAPLAAEGLAELARATDETRAAELRIGAGVCVEMAAMVIGTLASRLGPGRIRVHAPAHFASSLENVARCVQAVLVQSELPNSMASISDKADAAPRSVGLPRAPG